MLNEGALSNEGLFWISPKGKLIPVNVPPYQNYASHEEYAEQKWNATLEEALEKKYIRMQAIVNEYLFVDHRQNTILNAQIPTLEKFFYKNNKKLKYKHILVERIGNDLQDFSGNQIESAFSFAINGSKGTEEPTGQSLANKGFNAYSKQKDIASLSPYYQGKSSPLGDSVIGFKNWMQLKESQ